MLTDVIKLFGLGGGNGEEMEGEQIDKSEDG